MIDWPRVQRDLTQGLRTVRSLLEAMLFATWMQADRFQKRRQLKHNQQHLDRLYHRLGEKLCDRWLESGEVSADIVTSEDLDLLRTLWEERRALLDELGMSEPREEKDN